MRRIEIKTKIFTFFFFISVSCIGFFTTSSGNHLYNSSFIIPDSLPISVSLISKTNVSCNGGNNGAINISVSGGTPPYTFQWDIGDTTQNIFGLFAGTYTVTVTDSTIATATLYVFITQPTAIAIGIAAKSNVDCYGNNNGSIDLNVSGGRTPYIYNWSNGEITQDISGLFAGTHTVNVLDSNNCTDSFSVIITQPDSLTVITSSTPSVDGGCNGTVSVNVSGGIPPYTLEWFDVYGNTITDTNNLCPGIYFLKVTDSNGCNKNTKEIVSDSFTGIDENSFFKEITLFPNPASETITISLSPEKQNAFYEIYDLIGKKIERNKITSTNQTISVKNYNKGIYLLKISDGDKIYIGKFIKY